jgi:hypothetical protein
MKKWIITLILGLQIAAGGSTGEIRNFRVGFYTRQISLAYDYGMSFDISAPFGDKSPKEFDDMMQKGHYGVLLSALQQEKESLGLNDWLYFQLIRQSTDRIFAKKDMAFRTMADWFLLARSGYRVKLYYDSSRPYLFAYTRDKIFEMPYIQTKEGRFINLSYYFDRTEHDLKHLHASPLAYNRHGKAFVFKITELPKFFEPDPIERTLQFTCDSQTYSINIKGNKSAIAMERQYPKLSLGSMATIPLSTEAYESLIPAFRNIIMDKTNEEAVRMIMSFTRQAFVYKTDQEAYHEKNLIFSPEETLLSPYSDCEDRAILFTYMVKELLGIETIMLEYDDHVSAAVQLPQAGGFNISFGGKEYSMCEPTGPQDVLEIGQCPLNLQGKCFKVYQEKEGVL